MKIRTYIDGNSVGHAAQHGNGKQQRLYAGERETTAIFGMLRSMNVILRDRLQGPPVILWDGRSWRYNEFPDYKGNRTDTAVKVKEREDYRLQRADMFRAMHLLGVNQLVAGNMEADDLAAYAARAALTAGDQVRFITGDKDWLQLVQPGVAWIDHKNPRQCNHLEFAKFTGYATPKAFVHGKALQGDSGDNLPGCGGIGEKGAQDLLEVYGDVLEFIKMPQEQAEQMWLTSGRNLVAKKLPKKFQALKDDTEIQARFEFALRMMDLNHPSIPKPENIRATKSSLDRPGFEKFCAEFGFSSILSGMDRFIQPFVHLQKEYGN